jgi:hypothetical protein
MNKNHNNKNFQVLSQVEKWSCVTWINVYEYMDFLVEI